jgi:hypothetical protein
MATEFHTSIAYNNLFVVYLMTLLVPQIGRPGFDPRQGQRILPLTSVGPTQPPIQWAPGALSLRGKARPGRDADHSPPSSAEVKKE